MTQRIEGDEAVLLSNCIRLSDDLGVSADVHCGFEQALIRWFGEVVSNCSRFGPPLLGQDHRESEDALSQVVADRLADLVHRPLDVEDVIHYLECDAERVSIVSHGFGKRFRRSAEDRS